MRCMRTHNGVAHQVGASLLVLSGRLRKLDTSVEFGSLLLEVVARNLRVQRGL